MRIVHITLHDFRAFPGSFDLPLKNGSNLLLHGENGSGKSSLSAAVREFLNLERPFPRPVDPFVHVFPAPPDAAGVVPPRSARVELHFNTANPAEVIGWSSGRLHPLQLDDGTAPPSTTVLQRENLVGVSRQSGFIDYRALLRSSYRQGALDLGAQLFKLFVETLLVGFQPDGGVKTLGQFWDDLITAAPRTRRKGDMRRAKRATDAFNLTLTPFLDNVRAKANELLSYFAGHRMEIVRLAHPGCEYLKSTKALIGDRLELEITYAGLPLPKHEEFLNEARLTALGLSMFLAAVKLADSNPADADALRVLLLDDVLIGLDLSNRIPLLELLQKELSNHQIFLFTHDSVWFDIAKAHTEQWGKWAAFSLHADSAEPGKPEIPRLKGNMDDLAVAGRYLDNGDLRAAAVYVRAAFETRLRKICERKAITIPFKNNPHDVSARKLWGYILARHAERLTNQGKRFLDESLIPRINAVRSTVLNRLVHSGVPALTEPDVRAAIKIISDFRKSDIPFDE